LISCTGAGMMRVMEYFTRRRTSLLII